MYILQKQLENLKNLKIKGKVVLVLGARRCGKTTLLEHYIRDLKKEEVMYVTGDDIIVREYLSCESIEKLKNFVGNFKYLIIDEAQRIENIGNNLKLIVDHIPNISVIATGSSSFDLARQTGEPLTGRKITLKMFPLSQLEISSKENIVQTKSNLDNRLIYGSYPEVVLLKNDNEKAQYLKELVNAYLFKDILELEAIRHSNKLVDLLQNIAFQIGKEVSITELGTSLGMSKNTAEKYLDLLEKSFVVYRLRGFSRNLRKEIAKNSRYYFYDIGIRNALINNYNPLSIRDDVGMLWENYIVMERIKRQEYLKKISNNYFWRTYDQKEIDLIEEIGGKLNGYEIKWGKQKIKSKKEWLAAYPNSTLTVIDKDNYLDFIV